MKTNEKAKSSKGIGKSGKAELRQFDPVAAEAELCDRAKHVSDTVERIRNAKIVPQDTMQIEFNI